MAKWTLKTEFNFSAAHCIKDYDGPCDRMHSQNYPVRMEAAASKLHSSEYCSNEVMPEGYETTAEMIAKHIYDTTCKRLPKGVTLKVCVSEISDSWVEYEED